MKNRSWFNIVHLQGEKVMFDQVLDYPVQAFNGPGCAANLRAPQANVLELRKSVEQTARQ